MTEAKQGTTQIVSVKEALVEDYGRANRIEVKGWVRSIRSSKAGLSFISLNDGSCFDSIQIVAEEKLANYADVLALSTGSAITARGLLVASLGKGQDREIKATEIAIVGLVQDPENYPIAKKRHSFEYLRTVAHLRPRTNTFGAIARLRQALAHAIHSYFEKHDFVWVNTPIITASDCEGAGDLFRVSTLELTNAQVHYQDDFFGKETFLSVSGQLNVEAFCLALSKVYTFGPTFRAENSNTSRHLAEFWMVEPEIAFADLTDNVDLAEDFLKVTLADVLERVPDDIAFFEQRINKDVSTRFKNVIDKPFLRMPYSEAVDVLQRSKDTFEFPVEWGRDLQSEHEKYLTEHTGSVVVVTDYPAEIKAFYMRLNDDGRTVAAMDVLAPGIGEIIGGSQREERLDVLESRIDEEIRDELWWYRDLRKYGTVPHAGFGLGFERLLLYLSGMENIRDVIPFPRVPNNVAF
ncbi:MAG: asparagine--tRNA ligase [Gammaproteobacteria bacterium]|nr:asparagine--tRNA ligase [Gammaproteobacteria bacterium]